ncbi:MAG: class I SAM-dependent methyltransferase [Bacteroidia bacterium]|nr:class I SAM-dependent methyltransferase [Bacteroidia bacterium]
MAFSIFQLINFTLVIAFLFIVFKLAETNWSYKISKPHAWEDAIKNGSVSKKLKRIERLYRDKVRFYTFWFQIERLKKNSIAGSFAEVGVYKGGTAKIIHEMDPSRSFHLFDTFEGFDKDDLKKESPNPNHSIDFSDTNEESVIVYIGGNSNIKIHKGYFPATTENLVKEQFSFVHLDADLYNPTLAGLHYFYPLLAPGGVIIIHDYNHTWEGLTEAVDEFIRTIPESIVELADWQGSIMIIKNHQGS